MQLAYELLPVEAGQDENLPMAISHLRHRSRVYLLEKLSEQFHEPGFEDLVALRTRNHGTEPSCSGHEVNYGAAAR